MLGQSIILMYQDYKNQLAVQNKIECQMKGTNLSPNSKIKTLKTGILIKFLHFIQNSHGDILKDLRDNYTKLTCC